jgi:hypothetical protein
MPMYSILPGMVLGFHGCDRDVGEAVLSGGKRLKSSENGYDWLGHGVYFWENDPERALHWAEELCRRGKVEQPYVVGTVIDSGYCLSLLESKSLNLLRKTYDELSEIFAVSQKPLPQNTPLRQNRDLLLRYLDCAVIEALHQFRNQNSQQAYDTVRGVFWEGDELYPNAGFKEKNHIQVCVRNPNCIKGYFRVLEADGSFRIP